MKYIKNLVSTLASLNYYSSSSDLLDDHSTPSYLKYVSEHASIPPKLDDELSNDGVDNHLCNELKVQNSDSAKMNNSYPSR